MTMAASGKAQNLMELDLGWCRMYVLCICGVRGMKPGYIKTIMYLMMASVVYNDFITNV